MKTETTQPDSSPESTQADSSPASEQHHSTVKPSSEMTAAQRAEWLEKGTPMPKLTEDESETTKPDPSPEPKRKTGEERFHQLAAENRKLKERLEKLERSSAPPPEPVKQPKATETKSEPPKAPKVKEFDTWEQYEEARDRYTEALADYRADQRIEARLKEAEKQQRDAEIAKQNKAIEKSWEKRKQAAEAKHDDFAEVVADVPMNAVMDGFILDSEHGAEILYYLGANRKEAQRIAELGPYAAARELTRLEDKLGGAAGNGTAKATVSKAGPPAREVRATATAGDEAQSAVERRDFAAYKAIMNRREAAQRTGRG